MTDSNVTETYHHRSIMPKTILKDSKKLSTSTKDTYGVLINYPRKLLRGKRDPSD